MPSECECFKLLLLAIDEWKAHKEYSRMGEMEKAEDEQNHFKDFYERIRAGCPEKYKQVADDITKCEEG